MLYNVHTYITMNDIVCICIYIYHTDTRVCFRYIMEKYVPYFRGWFDSGILKKCQQNVTVKEAG